jgi:hypothetical protein
MRQVFRAATLAAALGTAAAVATPAVAGAATAPPGYRILTSAPIPIPPSPLDTGAQIACPTGTVALGGGAGFTGGTPDVGENINTSAPSGDGWRARYNNATVRPHDTFVIQAVCARKPNGYTSTFTTVTDPAHSQVGANAACPTGTVLLSGGTLSGDDTVGSQLLSAWPLGPHRFRGVMWNGGSTSQSFTVFALCAQKPPGYAIRSTTVTDAGGPSGSVDVADALCPAHTAVLGGGLHIQGPNPDVTVGASIQDSDPLWFTEAVSALATPTTATTFAICAA